MEGIAGSGMSSNPIVSEQDQPPDPDTLPAGEDEIEFVKWRLEFFIGDYKKKRNRSRDLSNYVRIISIGVGALVTVLIGARPSSDTISANTERWLSVITLVLSAGLTALGSWEAFADHRWKWIRYRATLSALYTIQDDFEFRQKGKSGLSVGDVKEFYMQVRNAVHETNQEWMAQRGNAITGGGKDDTRPKPS